MTTENTNTRSSLLTLQKEWDKLYREMWEELHILSNTPFDDHDHELDVFIAMLNKAKALQHLRKAISSLM